MDVLDTHVDRDSPEFQANHRRFETLLADLRAHLAAVRAGGGPRYLKRHHEQGKLFGSASSDCSIRSRRSSNCRRWPPSPSMAATLPLRASSPGSAASQAARS
jgi:hypothetical protein